jgi:Cdc6-like AAA superfamily ATPase
VVSSPPVVFHEQTDGGHKLFVAESIPNSTIVGPVYFSSLVKSNLFEFVQNEQCGDAVGLFIVGPPQSGKSAIIHEVLPAMFASSASNLTRVVVKIKFSRDETMETAISKVVDEVKAVADAFEIQTIGCPSAHATADSGSLKSYQFMYIKSVSRTLRTRHFQLWLLIDDCQVCMFCLNLVHFLFLSSVFFLSGSYDQC